MKKVIERETIQLLFASLGLLACLFFMNQNVYAAHASYKCETAFGEKEITIEGATVAFHNTQLSGRGISSVESARTQKTFKGFKKVLYKNGDRYLIHISNQNQPNRDEDYMAVTSPEGHKMTYPLACEKV